MNDILYVNHENLMTIYDQCQAGSQDENLGISDAIKMLEGVVPAQESEIRNSFHRAKMIQESQPEIKQDGQRLSRLEFLVFLCFTARNILVSKQQKTKVHLDELVSSLVQKLCMKFDLQLECPDVPLHDLYQNLSDDSEYAFDPLAKDGEEELSNIALPKKKIKKSKGASSPKKKK